jgi:hypothetical protein
MALWAAEEIDEDLSVDLSLSMGNYGQDGMYDDCAYILEKFCDIMIHHFCSPTSSDRRETYRYATAHGPTGSLCANTRCC